MSTGKHIFVLGIVFSQVSILLLYYYSTCWSVFVWKCQQSMDILFFFAVRVRVPSKSCTIPILFSTKFLNDAHNTSHKWK